eukprot:gene6155-12465_t
MLKNTCEEFMDSVKNMASNKNDESLMESHLRKAAICLVKMKTLSRTFYNAVEEKRKAVEPQKERVNNAYLRLENYLYIKAHLTREIGACKALITPDLRMLETELGGILAIDTFTPDLPQQHKSVQAALNEELQRRLQMLTDFQNLNKDKVNAEENLEKKRKFLDELPKQVLAVLGSTSELQKQFGLSRLQPDSFSEAARLLPSPLMLLHKSLQTFIDGMDQSSSFSIMCCIAEYPSMGGGSVTGVNGATSTGLKRPRHALIEKCLLLTLRLDSFVVPGEKDPPRLAPSSIPLYLEPCNSSEDLFCHYDNGDGAAAVDSSAADTTARTTLIGNTEKNTTNSADNAVVAVAAEERTYDWLDVVTGTGTGTGTGLSDISMSAVISRMRSRLRSLCRLSRYLTMTKQCSDSTTTTTTILPLAHGMHELIAGTPAAGSASKSLQSSQVKLKAFSKCDDKSSASTSETFRYIALAEGKNDPVSHAEIAMGSDRRGCVYFKAVFSIASSSSNNPSTTGGGEEVNVLIELSPAYPLQPPRFLLALRHSKSLAAYNNQLKAVEAEVNAGMLVQLGQIGGLKSSEEVEAAMDACLPLQFNLLVTLLTNLGETDGNGRGDERARRGRNRRTSALLELYGKGPVV